MQQKIDIPDGGSVRLASIDGGDRKIDARARASFMGTEEEAQRTDAQVTSLIRYLMRNRHTSPFEFVSVEFAVSCPLFVFGQLVRHRTASINAASGRYGALIDRGCYVPPIERCTRKAAPQQSVGELCDFPKEARDKIKEHADASKELERELVDAHGMSYEMARVVQPQMQSTQFFYKMNLHNFFHMLTLRLENSVHSHPQAYTSMYVQAMADLVRPHIPITWNAWEDYHRNAMTFSAPELDYLAPYLVPALQQVLTRDDTTLSKTERDELISKLRRLHV